ncbi:cysteine and histidine-rich domain-containing protein 1-like [Watersipora subatra]|uniref:cysteine and histidine-rich domain-containing protein 1-like n=1 Tax=Watersipora subatra TaxID=2589382 RepID=UPI00355C1FCC
MTTELQCYRKGCGKSYILNENSADACRYHPGHPVFHDALKGWSCCDKKSTDFSIFLDMPGCATGFHSNEKPAPAPKVESKPIPEEMLIKGPPPVRDDDQRPDAGETMSTLKSSVGATLKQALEKRMARLSTEQKEPLEELASHEVKVGTACNNNSCKEHYTGPESDKAECLYHPGVPVFHEGMKYWSCCQKKTTEFDKFMDQPGCKSGKHKWTLSAKEGAVKSTCRMDWHQTGSHVTISVFSKCADPIKTVVKVNRVAIDIYIVYEGDSIFTNSFELDGVINVEKSSVKLLGAKVEIALKKAAPQSWAQLKFVPEPAGSGEPK